MLKPYLLGSVGIPPIQTMITWGYIYIYGYVTLVLASKEQETLTEPLKDAAFRCSFKHSFRRSPVHCFRQAKSFLSRRFASTPAIGTAQPGLAWLTVQG